MQLEDLLQRCTVKLSIPGQLGWGTGFFVAPGLILTCAHVVQALVAPHRVRVRWQQQLDFAEAELIQRVPDLDLALLQFTPRKADLPCVYLDEGLQAGQDLYFFGYPDADFEHGCPVTGSCEGLTGDVSPLIKFKQAQVRRGMSGSARLNWQTGKVCGMVKFTLHRSSDLGGGAIPTTVILEQFPELRSLQRSFHGGDRRWSDLLSKVSEIDFQAYWGAIARHYEQWWRLHTLTDAEGQQQAQKAQPFFDFGLMVQPVVPQDDLPDRATAKEKVERFTVLAGLRKYVAPDQDLPHVLLVGRPGSGKSTALARLMLERVESGPIPVLVELRSWQSSVQDLIRAFLQRHELKLAIADIQSLLDNRKLLLLIDGVNELPSEAARSNVANFRRNHPKVPMIFTTRDLSLGGDLGIEKKLEMQPLAETQMKAFVQAYIPEKAEAMLRQLKERLRDFGKTPLLLWMLCEVFDQAPNQQLPNNLAETFQIFTRMYEDSSVRKHEVAVLKGDVRPLSDRRLWKPALMHLASVMMAGKERVDFRVVIDRSEAEKALQEEFPSESFPVRDILDDLLKFHLLQYRTSRRIEFRHQLIQEYYAAEWLLARVEGLDDPTLRREYLNYLKWTEPVALMLALVNSEAQAMQVVQQALDMDLILGARLAGEVKPEFQAQTVKFVEELEVPNWLKVELLGKTRSEHAIEYLKDFLAVQNSEIRGKIVSVFGEIVSASAIRDLDDATYDENEGVRGEAAISFGKIGTELAGLTLKEWRKRVPQETPYVDIRRQISLWDIFGDQEKPYLFREIAVDDDWDFDEFGDSIHTDSNIDFPSLKCAAKNESIAIRQFVVGELSNWRGSVHEGSVVRLLISLIEDPDYIVRTSAFRELNFYGRSLF